MKKRWWWWGIWNALIYFRLSWWDWYGGCWLRKLILPLILYSLVEILFSYQVEVAGHFSVEWRWTLLIRIHAKEKHISISDWDNCVVLHISNIKLLFLFLWKLCMCKASDCVQLTYPHVHITWNIPHGAISSLKLHKNSSVKNSLMNKTKQYSRRCQNLNGFPRPLRFSLQTNLQVCIPGGSLLNSSPSTTPFLDVYIVSGDGAAPVECGRLPKQHQWVLSHLQYVKPTRRSCVTHTWPGCL